MAEKQNAPETEKKKMFSFMGGTPEEKAKKKAEKAAAKEAKAKEKEAIKLEKAKAKEEAKAEKAKSKEDAKAQKAAAKEAKAKAKAEKMGVEYQAKPVKEKKEGRLAQAKAKKAANKALIEQYQAQNKPTMMNVNYMPPTGREETVEAKAHTGGPSCYSCCGPNCAIALVGIVLVLIVCCAYVSPKDQPCCSICYWPF